MDELCKKYDTMWNEEERDLDGIIPNTEEVKDQSYDKGNQSNTQEVNAINKDSQALQENNRKRKAEAPLECPHIMKSKLNQIEGDRSYQSPIKVDLSQSSLNSSKWVFCNKTFYKYDFAMTLT